MTEKSAKYFFKGFPQDLSKQSVIKQQVGNNQRVGGRKWQSARKEVFRPRYTNENFEPISFRWKLSCSRLEVRGGEGGLNTFRQLARSNSTPGHIREQKEQQSLPEST